MDTTLNSKVPSGPLESKWRKHRNESKLVSPNNKRKFDILVVGSGLAGASTAASLAEVGYNVKCFCFQDSPRRAHSIAAQGGINAAKNYQNDSDSVFRLLLTVKWRSMRVPRWFSPPAVTGTFFIFRLMRGAAMPPQLIGRTSAALFLPIPVTPRFILPAFRLPAPINPN